MSNVTYRNAQEELEALRAENALLRQASTGAIGCKLDEQGRFCITGVRGGKGMPLHMDELVALTNAWQSLAKQAQAWFADGKVSKNSQDPAFADRRAAVKARYDAYRK